MHNNPALSIAESAPAKRGVHVSTTTPTRLLRIEAALIAIVSIAAYRWAGGGWVQYVALWLIPDLFMVGYLLNSRVGAVAYNLSHNLVLPLGLSVLAVVRPDMFLLQLGLIWLSHVAIDRALGFGLKYASAFGDTHLGRC